MISETGNNLNIIIKSNFSNHDSWKSFATYISLKRILPDSKIYISLPRNKNPNYFRWINRTQVRRIPFYSEIEKISLENKDKFPLLVISNKYLLLRKIQFKDETSIANEIGFFNELNSDWLEKEICKSSENKYLPFVRLEDEIGRYDDKTWTENSTNPPFYITNRLRKGNLSLNEESVINFWESLTNLFITLG